jgi:hypothetical protein
LRTIGISYEVKKKKDFEKFDIFYMNKMCDNLVLIGPPNEVYNRRKKMDSGIIEGAK